MRKVASYLLTGVLVGSLPIAIAIADDISNNIDGTLDATFEDMYLTVGGPAGSVTYFITQRNGDGKSGCNLVGSTILTVSVNTSNAAVATVSPTSLTFTNCGDTKLVTVTPIGAGDADITLSQTANTTAGTFNLAPASFTAHVSAPPPPPLDTTPPVIVPTVDPAPNGAGWNNTDVTVSWSVTDPDSAISSSSGCDTVVFTDETDGTVVTCTATSEGGTDAESVLIRIDKTAPVINGSADPLPNGNGWNNTDVDVSFECAETGPVQSGVDVDTVTGDTTLTSEGADQEVTSGGSCIDLAGNEADPATVTASIDKTDPLIVITTPADGAMYLKGSSVIADWSVTDGLSGVDVASVTATTPDGSPVATTSTGAFSFTVSALDLAGNDASVTHDYTVFSYDFGGFRTPVSISTKDFKKMSTVPVKFQLLNDVTGQPVQGPDATLTVNGSPAKASGGSNVGNSFRYDATMQQYIYNLSTKSLSLGPNVLVVTIPGVGVFTTTIIIR